MKASDTFEDVISTIRRRVRSGRLPAAANVRVFTGVGAGYPCICCGLAILRTEFEYEIELNPLSTHSLTVMHAECYRLWIAVVSCAEAQIDAPVTATIPPSVPVPGKSLTF